MNMINNKILTLSQFLRFEGINVSIRSTIRASNIWDNFHNKFNSEELKDALRSVYVKNKEDIPRFERSYDYVFIYNKSIENKKIAIIGIGVSNIPLVEYFSKHNANVTEFDRKTIDK